MTEKTNSGGTSPANVSAKWNVPTGRRTDEWSEALVLVGDSQDRAAFTRFFRHFAPLIKAFALSGSSLSAAHADELVQEVMLTVWTRAASYNPALAAPSTWIFTIARNKAIDRARKRMRPQVDPHDPSLVPTPAVPNPDQHVVMMEWGHHIDAAMRELPEPQRAVVNAAYAEDRSMREIAEQQGVPVGTVKSRMRLAMKSLRLYFQQQGGLDAH